MAVPRGGRPFYGEALGILMLDDKAPCIPGDVGNANSYDFPVRFKVLNNIPCDWWFDQEGASKERLKIFIEKANELEQEGVRAITTGCGFFSVFQKEAVKCLKVPYKNWMKFAKKRLRSLFMQNLGYIKLNIKIIVLNILKI